MWGSHSGEYGLTRCRLTEVYLLWNKFVYFLKRGACGSVCVRVTHLGLKSRFLFLSDSCGFVEGGTISDERMGLSFTIAAGPRQRSHSRVRVPRDSRPHFTVSNSRLLQPGGPFLPIYIPHEQGGPVLGSLFVASYDSQGYGWGMWPRLHTRYNI
jgi:hypothetical protein